MHVLCGGESRHLDALGPGGSTQALYQQMAGNMGRGGGGGGGGGGGSGGSGGGGGGASFEALSGLGHFGPLEAPDTFAARVLESAAQRTTGRSKPPWSRL